MPKDRRRVEYDVMRIIACFCVIMIHCAVFDQGSLFEYNSWEFQAINIWGVLSRWAVPAFVMLSGMMTLSKADQLPIKKILIHRALRMVMAYILWSCVYSFYNTYCLEIVYAPTKLKTFIDGCFSGEIHMWYLLMLAGLYIISPLLIIMIKQFDVKWTKYWLMGMFLFSSVIPFVEQLDIKFISTIIGSMNGYMDLQFLGGWTFYYVLGYYINEHRVERSKRIKIYIISFICLLFTIYGTVVRYMLKGEPMGILPYEYPNIVIFSIGVVLFFKEQISKINWSNQSEKIIINISNLTFGIYLMHVLVLKLWYAVGININMCHPIIAIPIVSIIVFASSGCITWLIKMIPVVGKWLV